MIYIVKFTFHTKSGFGSFKAVFKSKEEANHALSVWKERKYSYYFPTSEYHERHRLKDKHNQGCYDLLKKTSKILKVLDKPKNEKEWMELINKFVLPQSYQLQNLFNWIAEDTVERGEK